MTKATEALWLGGKLKLAQPANSYRVAIDAAFLAAAVSLTEGGRALELGTGVGAAAMALAVRIPSARIDAVELQTPLAELARWNVTANGLEDRVRILESDLLDWRYDAGAYDAVFLNPPYLKAGEADPSPDPVKRIATEEGQATLGDWLKAAAHGAKTGARVTLIHRADRLADALQAFAAAGAGGLSITPLWPKLGAAASRVIVRGRKGKGGRLTLGPGLVLHQPDGAYTPEAAAILEGRAALDG